MDIESRIQKIEQDIGKMKADLDYFRPLALKAMEYMGSDPEASLNKARIAGEALSKRVYELTGGLENEKKPLAKMEFEKLMYHLRKMIPPTIVVHLETVQRLGNYGSHDHGPNAHPATPSDALTCLTALSTATSWYFETFFGESVQIIDSVSQPVDDTSAEIKKVQSISPAEISTEPIPHRQQRQSKTVNKKANGVQLPPRTSSFLVKLPNEKRSSVEKAIETAQNYGLRISLSARDLAIKIREDNRYDNLWKPTLAIITGEGEVEIVPKWIIPDIGNILRNPFEAEELFKNLVGELEVLRVRHPKYPNSYYYNIEGKEEQFISAIAKIEEEIFTRITQKV